MSKAILLLSSLLVFSGAFSHDGKSAQKVQTMDLLGSQGLNGDCSGLSWCGSGLTCNDDKTCVYYAVPKAACGSSAGGIDCVDGYWCREGIGSGLTCSSGKEGEACSNLGESCNGDLSCLSRGYCGKNAGPKEACGSSAGNVDCEAGYSCSTGIGDGGTCSSGKAGEACSNLGESCNDGLSCLSRGYCGRNAGPGEPCGSNAGTVDCGTGYWCTSGLDKGMTCSSGREGEACGLVPATSLISPVSVESCDDGLSCTTVKGKGPKVCVKNAGAKEACGSSAGGVDCGTGYWCREGIGSGYTCSSGKEGEACSFGGESCNDGLSCLSKGYCGANAGPGELCGSSAGNVDCGTDYYCTYDTGSRYTCVLTGNAAVKVVEDVGKAIVDAADDIGKMVEGAAKTLLLVAKCVSPIAGAVEGLKKWEDSCEKTGALLYKSAKCVDNIGGCVKSAVDEMWHNCRLVQNESVAECLLTGAIVITANVAVAVGTGGASAGAEATEVVVDGSEAVAEGSTTGGAGDATTDVQPQEANDDTDNSQTCGSNRRRLLAAAEKCSFPPNKAETTLTKVPKGLFTKLRAWFQKQFSRIFGKGAAPPDAPPDYETLAEHNTKFQEEGGRTHTTRAALNRKRLADQAAAKTTRLLLAAGGAGGDVGTAGGDVGTVGGGGGGNIVQPQDETGMIRGHTQVEYSVTLATLKGLQQAREAYIAGKFADGAISSQQGFADDIANEFGYGGPDNFKTNYFSESSKAYHGSDNYEFAQTYLNDGHFALFNDLTLTAKVLSGFTGASLEAMTQEPPNIPQEKHI